MASRRSRGGLFTVVWRGVSQGTPCCGVYWLTAEPDFVTQRFWETSVENSLAGRHTIGRPFSSR